MKAQRGDSIEVSLRWPREPGGGDVHRAAAGRVRGDNACAPAWPEPRPTCRLVDRIPGPRTAEGAETWIGISEVVDTPGSRTEFMCAIGSDVVLERGIVRELLWNSEHDVRESTVNRVPFSCIRWSHVACR